MFHEGWGQRMKAKAMKYEALKVEESIRFHEGQGYEG